jgi:hypothetical protein
MSNLGSRSKKKNTHLDPRRTDIVRWAGSLGAITAEALARREECTTLSARALLHGALHAGLLERWRPLVGEPALFTATRAGLRACGEPRLDPCRVTPSNARHLIVCARVAGALERCYPDHLLIGERELRLREREHGGPLASARIPSGGIAAGGSSRFGGGGSGRSGEPALHRPDLVLWPREEPEDPPVAIEVELTVKAPARLREICLAWARAREVAGVLYLAPPEVQRALRRAIGRAGAQERVIVLGFEAIERSIPSSA